MPCASATPRLTAKSSDLEVDVAVVGGGVVGLAVAAALARTQSSVVLFERHAGFGRETTSRNSEVIHAGLYYPEFSRKAVLCVEGRERLYAYCQSESIPHRKVGKYVVASEPAEVPVLESLLEAGAKNGAGALALVDGKTLREREPALRAVAGLWSPETGIVDALALCRALAAEAEAEGAMLALRHTLIDVEPSPGGGPSLIVEDPGGERLRVRATWAINSAGLEADALAARCGADLDANALHHRFCKGDYFALAPGAGPTLHHLIYPVPSAAGLGIHATLDLGGGIRLGPDTEYIATPDYQVDAAKAALFARAAGRYLSGVRAADLHPDYAGVRPKLAGPGESFRDFAVVEGVGAPGWIHLLGIESPGLTAALALGAEIARRTR